MVISWGKNERCGSLVNFLSSPYSSSSRHEDCPYIIYCADESFEVYISYSASALRASLDPRGKILAPRKSRLLNRDLDSQLLVFSHKTGEWEKIENINLESGGQTLKEMRIIENLVITDKMCQTADPVQSTGR